MPAEPAKGPGVRPASSTERLRFLFEVYSLLQNQRQGSRVTYSDLHGTVHLLQPRIREMGFDLGYRFDRRSFYGPWDAQLEEDLEVLDAAGIVDNQDERQQDVFTHNLHPSLIGTRLAALEGWQLGQKYLFDRSRNDLQKTLRSILQAGAS